MKKLVVPALVVAGLSASLLVGASSVSWAQEPAPSCAQAISAFLDARTAFEKLPEKVDNPALIDLAKAVERATKTRDERQTALAAAQTKADTTDTVVVADDRASVRDRIRAIEAHIAKDTTSVEDRAKHKDVILPTRQAELRAIDTLASAQSDLDAKTKAHADAPRRIDNPALKAGKEFDALVKTQTAADNACEGQPNDPGPVNPGNPPAGNDGNNDLNCGDFPLPDGRTAQQVLDADRSDPFVLDFDNDGLACDAGDNGNDNGGSPSDSGVDSVVTPVGGVETGGGPE